MTLNPDNLLNEVLKLDCVKKLKVSVENSVKYGTLVGAATVMSGLLFGPRGLVIGGVLSSCAASYASSGEFKSVPHIILYETTPEERKELAGKLWKLVTTRNIKTLQKFIYLIQTNKGFLETVVQVLTMFLSSKMGYEVHA
ncbi:protein C19orf12 homolog [Lasioglossum baleicum]|uniref:protein C19orf12 homolog n=1 Tax=Lasioglossum baleicum TaxID=434251 RepID=UPI003FCDA565